MVIFMDWRSFSGSFLGTYIQSRPFEGSSLDKRYYKRDSLDMRPFEIIGFSLNMRPFFFESKGGPLVVVFQPRLKFSQNFLGNWKRYKLEGYFQGWEIILRGF